MKITVVGSGHGGCAMAAVLSMRGHDVSIVKLSNAIHEDNYEVLRARRAIRLLGIEGQGDFRLRTVTHEPGEAIPDAEMVLVYYVANYHGVVARRCAPHLHEGQAVVMNPGYCGSLLFLREMKAIGRNSFPLFAEFETLPYSSRIIEPGTVDIVSRNVCHPFATLPASRAHELTEHFESVLGKCIPRKHLLEVALHNPNIVIHTAGVVMNASLVENEKHNFAMYRDGFSPSVWNVVHQLDAEKMQILEKLGADPVPYFDEFRLRTFDDLSIDGLVGFRHYASEAPAGPFTVRHRYVTEDVPIGLGLLHSLGLETGVPTPICTSLINIAAAMLPDVDIWGQARTLRSLWDGTLEELLMMLTA